MTATEQQEPVHHVQLNFDFDKLREIGRLGVRRASAFMCLGLIPTQGDRPKALSLDSAVAYQFLPNPLPDTLASVIVSEYRIWLIGNALRELDLHCHLFLDEAWRFAQYANLHNQRVKADFKIPEITSDTNASSKLAKVYGAIGATVDKDIISQLWTHTNVRNCLTHNAGVVSERYANKDGKHLSVNWLGQEIQLIQDDDVLVVDPKQPTFEAQDPSKETCVRVVFKIKEKNFDLRQQVEFSPHELHEICFYYLWLTDRLTMQVQELFKSKGLLEPRKEEAGPAPINGA